MDYELYFGRSAFGIPFLWKEASNAHICITGRSGEGKTFLLLKLISQLQKQKVRCVVFDCSGDFCPKDEVNPLGWQASGVEYIDAGEGIPIAPFRSKSQSETCMEIAQRLTGMICACFRLGEIQWAYLSGIIRKGLRDETISSFSDLITSLEEEQENRDIARRLLPKLSMLNSHFSETKEPVDWKLETPGLTIVNLHGICDDASQAVLTEMLLEEICGSRMRSDPGAHMPIVLVFDECQRLRFQNGSLITRVLREGRKYAISGWFSTQWIQSKTMAGALGQAALHVFFRPEDEALHKTAKMLAGGNRSRIQLCERRLATLKRGQFLIPEGGSLRVLSMAD